MLKSIVSWSPLPGECSPAVSGDYIITWYLGCYLTLKKTDISFSSWTVLTSGSLKGSACEETVPFPSS